MPTGTRSPTARLPISGGASPSGAERASDLFFLAALLEGKVLGRAVTARGFVSVVVALGRSSVLLVRAFAVRGATRQ
jgi:hypothetical protein